MVKPKDVKPSRTVQKLETAQEREVAKTRLQASLDETLRIVQQHRLALKQVQDGGFDLELVQLRLKHLTGLHGEVKRWVDGAAQLDGEVEPEQSELADFQEKSAAVEQRLSELKGRWKGADGVLADGTPLSRKEVRRQLQEVILQLQGIVNGFYAEFDGADEPEIQGLAAEGQKLQAALADEREWLSVSELGQAPKAKLLSRLQQLTLLVYRLQQLAVEPRLLGRSQLLMVVAAQLKDTAESLDLGASNVSELLDGHIFVINQQLSKLAYNRRCLFFPLPGGNLLNLYRYVAQMKSVQGRVLYGLGLTLALSGAGFSIVMLVLSSASASKASIEASNREVLNKSYETLVANVTTHLNNEEERDSLRITLSEASARTSTLLAESSSVKGEAQQSNGESRAEGETQLEREDQVNEEADKPDSVTGEQLQAYRQTLLKKEQEAVQRSLDSRIKIREAIASIETTQEKVGPRSSCDGYKEKVAKYNCRVLAILETIVSPINDKGILNQSRRILLAAFAGALGSMLSILIRLEQIEQEDIKNPFLLGALKPLIGSIFGIAVFAILSTRVVDILPSSFYLYDRPPVDVSGAQLELPLDPLGDLDSQELYKIFLVAFLAGFSERLASDSLKSVGASRSLG